MSFFAHRRTSEVIEGIAPIWTDLIGDGRREIIVTVSNTIRGAQLVVFNERSEQIGAGRAIGRGFRMRHQLAAAPLGPNGELELVDVLTPYEFGGNLFCTQRRSNKVGSISSTTWLKPSPPMTKTSCC